MISISGAPNMLIVFRQQKIRNLEITTLIVLKLARETKNKNALAFGLD